MQRLPLHLQPSQAAAAGFGLLIGVSAALSPELAASLVLVVALAIALRAPTPAWVGASVALVLLVRVPTFLGALPEAAVQLPIITAWLALALALVRNQERRGAGNRLSMRLGILVVAAGAAAVAGGTEIIRPLFYLSLIGTPFALLAAILLDPPDRIWRRRLIRLILGVVVIQIPFVLLQTATYGIGDQVRGTLLGSDIGAQQVASVAAIGAIWLALNGPHSRLTLCATLLLATIPMLAAANQVILVIPLALVGSLLANRSGRAAAIIAIGGTALLLLLLLAPGWNSDYVRQAVGNVGKNVKAEPAEAIATEMTHDGRTLLFGQGPAETVSGAGFLTTEDNNLVDGLGLKPATFPLTLQSSGEVGSIQRPISSVLGVIGDLGLFGAAAFAALFGFVFNRTRRHMTPLGQTATAGLTMLLALGFFNDALEQPPFALFVAALVGLALTDAVRLPRERDANEPTEMIDAANA